MNSSRNMNVFKPAITDLIPQRPPFVMVGELVSSDASTTSTSFRVPPDNIFVSEGYFTEPGLLENIAQTAAARAGYTAFTGRQPVAVGYIGAVKNLEIRALPLIGDLVETTVTVQHQVFDVTLVSGEVRCKGALLASCEMKIFIPPSK